MLSSPPPLEIPTALDLDTNTSSTSTSTSAMAMAMGGTMQPVPLSPAASSISSILSSSGNHHYQGPVAGANHSSHLHRTASNNSATGNGNTDFLYSEGSSDYIISRNPSVSSNISNSQYLTGASLEWQDITLTDLVETNKLIRISSKISVEKAFQTLVDNGLTSVPVEEFPHDLNCLTFDYTDLNAYLLLVLNKLKAEELRNIDYQPREEIPNLIKRAQRGEQVPVDFVIRITNKNPFIKLSEFDTLSNVVEILGSGVHRIAITNTTANNTTLSGILSQRRLIKYLWDNARRFPSMEPLLSSSIRSLHIGSANPIAIYGDQPLIEALITMHTQKMSSLAVVDRNYHLLGNISVTDVRLVSTSSKSELLYKSCLHFISVILNSRGLENGKDSFPIFHVTSHTSLGRAIAKLVATKSHRLWIVKPDSISSSPTSESHTHHYHHHNHNHNHGHGHVHDEDIHATGKLVGVLSLTDILALFAKTLGKSHVEPNIARRQRRRSSSGAQSIASVASMSTTGTGTGTGTGTVNGPGTPSSGVSATSGLEVFRRSISEQQQLPQ
jgi:CBS domain-containing protein